MRVGVVFPQTEIGPDPGLVRDFAQAAEALGYSHILAYDHVVGAVHAGRFERGYDEKSMFHEPLTLFAYLAGVTERIEFATGVLILPQRQTVLVAKQAAEVQVLSAGRLRLGVGTGWNWVEYQALGVDWESRAGRFEDQVDLLRELWTSGIVDRATEHHTLDRIAISPRPAQAIPVWFGGFSKAAQRRAARVGDGFIFAGDVRNTLGGIEYIQGLRAARGASDPFGFDVLVPHEAGPGEWENQATFWADRNATHITLRTLNCGLVGAQHLRAIEDYARRVLPSGVLTSPGGAGQAPPD